MNRFVIYYRLSLMKDGSSGLGLDAQRAMFSAFLLSRPGEVVGEYTEVETGKTLKKSLKRPELTKAIDHARAAGATLAIARLDRLARNVAFISTLLESDLPVVCCDIPEADRFVLHILAAVAQKEGELISSRTKAALKALQERGVLLGSSRPGHWDGMTKDGTATRAERRTIGLKKAQVEGRKRIQEEMSQRYEPIVPWIRDMRAAGQTLQEIVDNLNAKGCRTRSEKPWNTTTLRAVILKYLGQSYLGYPGSKVRPCLAMEGRN